MLKKNEQLKGKSSKRPDLPITPYRELQASRLPLLCLCMIVGRLSLVLTSVLFKKWEAKPPNIQLWWQNQLFVSRRKRISCPSSTPRWGRCQNARIQLKKQRQKGEDISHPQRQLVVNQRPLKLVLFFQELSW